MHDEARGCHDLKHLDVQNRAHIEAVRARPGQLRALSILHSESFSYGAFVWARRALNSPKRRFPARAVRAQLPRYGAADQSEEDAKLAQKLGQPQPLIAVSSQRCMGQLVSFGQA